MIKLMRTDVIKIFTGYGFYVSILFTLLLCFSSEIYMDEQRNEKYSVINVLQNYDAGEMLEHPEMCFFSVAIKGSDGWLALFIPIIAGFPFVPILCDEYNAGAVRNAVYRSTNFRFHTARFLSAILSAGLSIMAGYALFVAVIYFLFPDSSSFSKELQQVIREEMQGFNSNMTTFSVWTALLVKLGEIFLYGAFSVIITIFLCSFNRNKYLVLCIPFFMQYALTQFCIKIGMDALSDLDHPNISLFRLSNIIKPNAVANLSQYSTDIKYILLYQFVLALILYIGYLALLHRRMDYGE